MDIRKVDIREIAIQRQVNDLLNASFGFQLQADEVYLNTKTSSMYEPLYLAAFEGEKVVGFNAYIAHDCEWKGEPHVFYQSCWSAVDRAHRGKRIFFHLQTAAREPLKAIRALGILGLPNERSGPILRGPLAYEFHGGYLRKSFLLPQFFAQTGTSFSTQPAGLMPSDEPLYELKMRQARHRMIAYEDEEGNRLWGKYSEVRKFGIPIRHFLVGGISMQKGVNFQQFVRKACASLRIRIITFLYHESAAFGQVFTGATPSNSGYLCWYPLCAAAGEITEFNCWVGLSDVF